MQLSAGDRLGPYEVVGPVGAGGMGEVYKARDTRLERSVAVKFLPREMAENAQLRVRFEREAKAISQLNHPHICTLYDIGENYIVMELLDGESLAERLARGPLPLRDVLKIAVQLADALDRAHRAGIVHRDVKPANIMLTRAGTKLLDFGLAKSPSSTIPSAADDATQHKPLTQEGTIVGTFNYMAPEQIEGGDVDGRADTFAFGAVLYEMITGRRAFEGKTTASTIAAVLEHDPPALTELQPVTPAALERLVSICLEKNAEDRWQSMHDVRRELEWIRTDLSSPGARAQVSWPRSTRLPRTAALLLALTVLGAVSGWVLATRRFPPPAQPIASSILPPENIRFVVMGDAAGPMTLSPDGRHGVFAGLGPNGVMLWLQTLATGHAAPLPGTERGMFPFWSPDSRSIGFFASAKLLVTEIHGSSPRVIADAPDARGGCWGPDGNILFAPFTREAIFRVPAAGGPAERVTTLESPYTTHRWPAMLEDGKHFVYLAANHSNPTSTETAVFLAPTAGGQSRKITSTLTSAFPYRDQLVYLDGSKLVAQRLTKNGLEGPRRILWEDTLADPGTWRTVASVSSNGLLATFRSSATTTSRLVWVDRSGRELEELEPAALYRDVVLSPDGTKVALAIGDPLPSVFIHDLVRRVRSRFSFVPGAAANPAWTPDGRTIVFEALMGTNRYQIFVKPADGREDERVIAEATHLIRPTDVDREGRVIYDAEQQDAVHAIPLTGGSHAVVVQAAGQQHSGAISPDGRWIAYINADANGRTAFVSPYPNANAKWPISGDSVMKVMWTREGREIVYLSADGQMKAVPVTVEEGSIALGSPEPLFHVNVNTNRRSIAAAPDGSKFLIVDPRVDELGSATLVANFDRPLR